jgi:hypothetical protein
MSSPQIKSDRDARAEDAFFEVETEIRDLRHMALIAADLAFSVVARSGPAQGTRLITIGYDEFERIQFAVSQTRTMAENLVSAFAKEFERAKEGT